MVSVSKSLAAVLVGASLVAPAWAVADPADAVSLFRVVSVRDEVTVGFVRDEMEGLGTRAPLDFVAEQLARQGYVIGWQYAVGRGADGSLRQLPQRRIAIYAQPVVRLEPVRAEQPIDPPKP